MPTITLPKTVNTRDTQWTLLVKWAEGTPVNNNPMTGGWFDSIPFGSINNQQFQINTAAAIQAVTVGFTGHANALRFYASTTPGTATVKMALYNSAGTSLLASTSGTILTTNANSVQSFTIASPPAITSGTYLLALEMSPPNSFSIGFQTGVTGGLAGSLGVAFASFPPASVSGFTPQTNANYYMGVLVQ